MRILFVTNSLGAKGGIERVTMVKANCFAEMHGVEVAIAFSDRLDWPNNAIHQLSSKVKTFDMQCPFWDIKPTRFGLFGGYLKNLLVLRKKVKKVIVGYQPDVVITTGQFEKYVLPFVSFRKRKYILVREYHFASNYRQIEEKVRSGRVSLKSRYLNWFESNIISRFFDKNYLLTKRDIIDNHLFGKQFDYMYNPSTFEIACPEIIASKKHIVLAAGRFTQQKNFPELIEIWSKVDRGDWILKILGDGAEMGLIKSLIAKYDISDSVELAG